MNHALYTTSGGTSSQVFRASFVDTAKFRQWISYIVTHHVHTSCQMDHHVNAV
jgi:hypothetical protein